MSARDDDDQGPLQPRENDYLIGHEQAEADLKAAFHSEKLAHAWLMTGPRGIGKATLAYRFARYVLKNSQASDAESEIITAGAGLFGEELPATDNNATDTGEGLYLPPDDRVFMRTASMGHADLMSIERQWKDDKQVQRKTTIAVDDVRKVGGFMRMTPAEGGWRVVIVDAADEMNHNAANALLKVLEEPPVRSLLLLVAHNPGRLLPTIRSRCRKLPVSALNDANVTTLLGRYATMIPDHDKKTLIDLAQGSIGKALDLAAGGGLDVYDELNAVLGELPQLDAVKLHKLGDKLARKENEASFRMACELLQFSLSKVIRCAATNQSEDNSNPLISRLSGLATLDRWLEVWEKVSHLIDRSDAANLDRKQVTLNIFHALAKTVTH
ncbi:MAG: DNA polymerase III subunit delta' [Rhodospirillales bacterium]|jgi:DNA polymerase III subunit delta'|nr:DNA polymerase III subunit delta' [Rhodospirillales bacterium]